ncbi:MAG TPA: hypothetical protein VGA47_00305 [Candidatus Dormibacteraeota bacterium]
MPAKSIGVALILFALVACGSDSGGGANAQASPGVALEVDVSGQPIVYLSSNNVDPSSIGTDDANSHKIATLPSGLVQVCHYTLSQGVNWTVWAVAGNQDSIDFAKEYCHRNGQ